MATETLTYKTVGGHPIRADVHVPSAGASGKAVLVLHGGGLIMGNRGWLASEQVRRYTAAGLALVSIDYRLAPETKLPEIVCDVADAYDWMRTQGSARFGYDPDGIAVMGYSAGGYLALLGGARFRPRPRALVSFYGYGDLTGPWYAQPSAFYNRRAAIAEAAARGTVGTRAISEDPMSASASRGEFYVYCRQRGVWPQEVAGHQPAEHDWFAPFEPLRNVSFDYPPTLLLHGEADSDVPFEQSVRMRDELARHGVEHELISEPAWDHCFDLAGSNDPKVARALDRVVQFLVEH